MKILWLVLFLSACAAAPERVSENEQARRAVYREKHSMVCYDLKAPTGDAPFLSFTMQEKARISDLHFREPSPRYDGYAIPRSNIYGPYKGEAVEERDSPYFGANDFKISERFHLFLPDLTPGFETVQLARDRDSLLQNAAAETSVLGQRYDSILHLRCLHR